jgi:hypothetical protein
MKIIGIILTILGIIQIILGFGIERIDLNQLENLGVNTILLKDDQKDLLYIGSLVMICGIVISLYNRHHECKCGWKNCNCDNSDFTHDIGPM